MECLVASVVAIDVVLQLLGQHERGVVLVGNEEEGERHMGRQADGVGSDSVIGEQHIKIIQNLYELPQVTIPDDILADDQITRTTTT